MRSLIMATCIVAAMTCIWTEFLRPYHPLQDAPYWPERIRQVGRLWIAGMIIVESFLFLYCDLEYTLRQTGRLAFLGVALMFLGLSVAMALGIWPRHPAPNPTE